MTRTHSQATAVTETGEAPVVVDLRQERIGLHTSESGTVAIEDTAVWRAIANTGHVRLRLPDGREGAFQAPHGAGAPPTPGNPARFRVERSDGETF
ncbi:hypothetical protein [Streptomyces sp. NPDC006879]|uniref:hypothetical protein n=1 Tax=Streptomyces sp. NPDC006879 TaxID=3364767 RepID=UPI00367FE693